MTTPVASTFGRRRKTPPIVLIHGMGSASEVWTDVSAELGRSRETHVLTLLGHAGGTQLATRQLSISDLVLDLEEQLDILGIEQAHMVGNSIGGWLALCLADRGRTLSVTCLAPAGGWMPGGWFEQSLVARFLVGQLAFRFGGRGVAALLRRPWGRRLVLGMMVAEPHRMEPEVAGQVVQAFAECAAVLPLSRRVRFRGFHEPLKVDVPVLIAWSERDRILHSPRSRARFSEIVPEAEVIELVGVGHVPMLDDPDAVARTVMDQVHRVEHGDGADLRIEVEGDVDGRNGPDDPEVRQISS